MRDSIALIAVLLVTWLPALILWWWISRVVRHVDAIGERLNEVARHVRQHCDMDARLRAALLVRDEHVQASLDALHRAAAAHEEGHPWLS